MSSTFADLKAERNALQARVFPKLRELCMRHGARFQAIDLRWGVTEEAALDQQTMNLCLNEIRRCQQVTPRPNFVVLLGERYGWLPVPPQIPAEEFEQIRARVSLDDAALLEQWYRRDDNAVPPEYCLQPRRGEFVQAAVWARMEKRLHQILLEAVEGLDLPQEARVKYERSATEQEILGGALIAGTDHAFCYFRTVEGLPRDASAADYRDLDDSGRPDAWAEQRLQDLKHRLREHFPSSHVHEYIAQWDGARVSEDHLDALCAQLEQDLSRVILEELGKFGQQTELEHEIETHRRFGEDRARHFIGRQEIIGAIRHYVLQGAARPLVVWGPSGCGKSALLARCVQLLERDLPDAHFIYRFIGATPASTDLRSLLQSLCEQLYTGFREHYEARKAQRLAEAARDRAVEGWGVDGLRDAESTAAREEAEQLRCVVEALYDLTGDARALARTFANLLQEVPKESRVVIFLDALDQLSPTDAAHYLNWLPTELPANVRLVVSALEREGEGGGCLRAARRRLLPESFVEVTPLSPEEGAQLLDLWLEEAGRTLQAEQRADVLGKFSRCPFPLYLKLAFEEARRWKSYDGLPPGADGVPGLGEDVPGVIADMLWCLERPATHGDILVRKALGYLAAARNGLTEDEILDVLTEDEELWNWVVVSARHELPERRLPVVIWSRLYFDLEPYLTERAADGTSLINFYHRQVEEVVKGRYLGDEQAVALHRSLGQYFARQPHTSSPPERRPNLRQCSELPYQQTLGADWGGLEDTLTDLGFLETKAEAGRVFDLGMDFTRANRVFPQDRPWARNLRLLEQALRADLNFIARHPTTLFQCFWNRAWWYDCVQAAAHYDPPENGWGPQRPPWECPEPKLSTLLERWRREKTAGQPGHIWLRSLRPPPVPLGGAQLACLRGHESGVSSVAWAPSGRRIASACWDGTVRVWDANTGEEVACLGRQEDEFLTVAWDPAGERVASGSVDRTVRIWDAETNEEIACLR